MNPNQILQALVRAKLLDAETIIALLSASEIDLSPADVTNILRGPYEPKFLELPDYVLLTLLNEWIIDRRGARDDAPKVAVAKTAKLTLNEVLKKLRIAFNLQEQATRDVLKAATVELSKSDLSALFRKANHPLYKACDAELLENFIEGLGIYTATGSAHE